MKFRELLSTIVAVPMQLVANNARCSSNYYMRHNGSE